VPALIPPREHVGALHDQMLGLIRTGGYEPTVVPAPLNFSAGTQMVVAGAGWILAVKSSIEYSPPGTAVLPLEDGSYQCNFYLMMRADDDRRAVREFAACMEEVVGGMR
jgi:DNA-binding transcriptional LysR family regulator